MANILSSDDIAFALKVKDGDFSVNDFPKLDYWNPEKPLKDFQKIGAAYLYAINRCILADNVGLGKTIQSLAYICLRKQFKLPHKAIILIPTRQLQEQWYDQTKLFTKLRVINVDGNVDKRRQLYAMNNWDVMLLRYSYLVTELSRNRKSNVEHEIKLGNLTKEALRNDLEIILSLPYDVVICDEATVIRNHNTKTKRAVLKLTANKYGAVMVDATPVQTSLLDLHSLIEATQLPIFGNRWSFDNKYIEREPPPPFLRNKKGRVPGKITGYKNLADVKEKMHPYILRRTRHQVDAEMPEVVYQKEYLELHPRQKKLYNECRVDILQQSESILSNRKLSPAQQQKAIAGNFHKLQYLANSTIQTSIAETKVNTHFKRLCEQLTKDLIPDLRGDLGHDYETLRREAAKIVKVLREIRNLEQRNKFNKEQLTDLIKHHQLQEASIPWLVTLQKGGKMDELYSESETRALEMMKNFNDEIKSAESNKIDWLINNIKTMDSKEKVLVFSKSKNIISYVMMRCKKEGINAVDFIGDTPAKQRAANIKAFWEDPNNRILIGNITFERGLNLQTSAI